ncbi:MAG: acetyl-CoA carboxylase biotin carboxyl carrier protein subunit [Oligoflexia bacterium]|nr:acetyl-CoA carboxylase biotin carboxyl carrier protein subunit [Oligoflexia bacterium]
MKTLIANGKKWIHFDGKIYSITSQKKKGSGTEAETTDLVAPFSCKVTKLFAKPGQSLKKGDPVVTVESMKMEYSYESPKDGEVAKVLVQIGQILQAGDEFIQWK